MLSGVEYHYEVAPDSPPDIWKEDTKRFGRRLLDGIAVANWYAPVGLTHSPLVANFDFKRQRSFNEVGIVAQSNKVSLKTQCANAESGPRRTVFEHSLEACPEKTFIVCRLTRSRIYELLDGSCA